MDKIGKYNGIDCFRVTRNEYIKNEYYKNDDEGRFINDANIYKCNKVIFIIDKDMVYKNMVIGTYDGKYVNDYDRHKQYTYYEEPIGIATTYRADGKVDEMKVYEVSWNSKSEMEMEMETDKILRMVYDKEGYVSKLLLEAVM